MNKPCIIVDLDGTLCDDRPRRYLVERNLPSVQKDFPAYYAKIPEDNPNLKVLAAVKLMAKEYYVVLMTARPEETREATVAWLNRFKVPYDELLMRPPGNIYLAPEAKKHLLLALRARYPKIQVLYALDDELRNRQMFEMMGITALAPMVD